MYTKADPIGRAAGALWAMQRQSWEQGVAMQAFFELGDDEAVIRLAFEAANRMLPDGRVAMVGAADGVTDPCAAGEALGYAARLTGDPALAAAHAALVDWAVSGAPRSPGGGVYHLTDGRQFWADSLYMLPPFLASAGHFREALAILDVYWSRLYDPEAHLLAHKWDEGAARFVRAAHWGVGNGWTAAALARLYDLAPPEFPEEKESIAVRGRALVEGLIRRLRPDGLFHDVVDDPSTFVEVNLSQMLAYAVFRGMASGWLPALYLEKAEAMMEAASVRVDAWGFVRGVCGAPGFDSPGIAPEGQAFFLLMHAAARKYRDRQTAPRAR